MNRAKRITKVVYTEDLNNTPAAVNRSTGVLYIKPSVFNSFSHAQQAFIILHERAHVELDTDNEFLADEEAFRQYVKKGFPLSQSIYALSRVLTMNSPEHLQRVIAQLQRAKQFDKSVNHNAKVSTMEDRITTAQKHYVKHKFEMLTAMAKGEIEKAKEHLEEILRHHIPANEQEKVRAKHYELFEAAQKVTEDCQCNKVAAFAGQGGQGGQGGGGGNFDPSAWGTGLGALLGGVSTIIDSATGNAGATTGQPATVIVQTPEVKKDNTLIYVVGGSVVVIALLVVVYMMMKNKKG